MQAIDRMISVRSSLIMEQPFFGALAMRMDWVEDKGAKGLWTDGKNIGFNPTFALEAPFDELKARICEIVMHNAHGHPWRRDARDSKKWNIACDRALWFDLQRSGFPLPKDVHYQAADDGAAAELIYSTIPDDPPQQQPQPSPQSGQGAGAGDSALDKGDEKEDGEEPQNDPPQHQEPEPNPDPGSMGEVRDYAGPDARAEEDEWKQAVLQAAQAAKMMGKMPGGLEKLLAQIRHPAVDWRAAMLKFLDQSAKDDYSWRRPNRRYVPLGFYLPEIRSERMRGVLLGGDVSYSIGQKFFDVMGTEMTQMMRETRPEKVYFGLADVEVTRKEELTCDDEIKFGQVRRGGTDMTAFFRWVEEDDLDIACAIIFTDMETPFGEDPGYPVLWVTQSDIKAPFGETLKVENI